MPKPHSENTPGARIIDIARMDFVAKALGLVGYVGQDHRGLFFCVPGPRPAVYKWLDSDGDALRAVQALKITIAPEPSMGGWSAGAVVNGEFSWLWNDTDLRSAIFVAAAAIGEAMP